MKHQHNTSATGSSVLIIVYILTFMQDVAEVVNVFKNLSRISMFTFGLMGIPLLESVLRHRAMIVMDE